LKLIHTFSLALKISVTNIQNGNSWKLNQNQCHVHLGNPFQSHNVAACTMASPIYQKNALYGSFPVPLRRGLIKSHPGSTRSTDGRMGTGHMLIWHQKSRKCQMHWRPMWADPVWIPTPRKKEITYIIDLFAENLVFITWRSWVHRRVGWHNLHEAPCRPNISQHENPCCLSKRQGKTALYLFNFGKI
jgi:hypothetical protein